jgi:uncharacterized protein (DUF2267 family)
MRPKKTQASFSQRGAQVMVEDEVSPKEVKAVLDELTAELRKLFKGSRIKQACARAKEEHRC